MPSYMADMLGALDTTNPLLSVTTPTAVNSTNKKAGKDLEMTDFLTLMVAMFQNQTIDNTADTSDMMNMMVQMSIVESLNNVTSVVTDTSKLSYAASLVGKNVTIGEMFQGGEVRNIYGMVEGTGVYNGEQVVFVGGKMYKLSQIMSVGYIPGMDVYLNDADQVPGSAVDPDNNPLDQKPVEVESPDYVDGKAIGDNENAWDLVAGNKQGI